MKKTLLLFFVSIMVLTGCSTSEKPITGRFLPEARNDINMSLFPIVAIDVEYVNDKYQIKLYGDITDPDIVKEFGESGIATGNFEVNPENIYNMVDTDFHISKDQISFEAFGTTVRFIREPANE